MLPPDEYDIAATAERIRTLFTERQVWFDHRFDLEEWQQRNARLGFQVGLAIHGLACGRGDGSVPPDQEAGAPRTVLDFLAEDYAFEGGPDEVRAFVEGTFPMSIEDTVKFAAFLGCNVGDFSPYHQGRIDAVAEFSTGQDEVEQLHARLEAAEEHLEAIAGALPRWLKLAQVAITERIVAAVRSELASADAPEEVEGITSALDYMGLLRSEGSDNGLYQLGMDMVDMLIRHQLDALPPPDQVAVLLPLCDRSRSVNLAEDLVANLDVSVDDWAAALRKDLADGWTEQLQDAVLTTIPSRGRHE